MSCWRWFWLCRSENNGWRGQSNLSLFGLISRTYLHSAKRLNSCQAHWALFLGRFNFTRTYLPGSRNLKLDTPSHQLTPEPSSNMFSVSTESPQRHCLRSRSITLISSLESLLSGPGCNSHTLRLMATWSDITTTCATHHI